MKKFIWAALGAFALVGSYAVYTQAQAPTAGLPGCTFNSAAPVLSDKQSVAVQCDTNGQLKITGTISASSTVTSTAAAPTYIEGTTNPFSSDLSGALRVTGSISATSAATATAAAPSYVEGTSNPVSQNLTGDQRVIAKQSGAWVLSAGSAVIGHVIADTGSTTAVTGNVTVVQPTGTNLHAVLDTTSTTAVTQATGTNLHAVLDTTSTTAVTQATASNLNATVVGTGTLAVQPAGSIAFDGAAAAVNPILDGCYASAAAPTDVSADNDATRAWCLRNGARASVITAAGALVGGDAANGLDVDVTRLPALVAGAAVIGKVGIDQTTPGTTNLVQVTDGSGALNVIVDSGAVTVTNATAANLNAAVVGTGTAGSPAGNILTVQGVASMTKLLVTPDSVALPANQSVNAAQINGVTPLMGTGNTGTGSLRVTIATDQAQLTNKLLVTPDANSAINLAQVGGTTVVNGGVAGSQSIGGTVATNVAITANPINLGAQAVSSENAAATTARQVQLVADLVGKLIVLPYANPENFVTGTTAAMTGTTSTSLIAAPAGSLRNYITQISCVNSHATVGTFVSVQDGNGGTNLFTLAAASVFGGETITFPVPLRQPTTATALYVADVTTGANVICSATGYKGL